MLDLTKAPFQYRGMIAECRWYIMFFELQDAAARKAAYELHARMIKVALEEIFQFPSGRAERSVTDLLQKYDDAPEEERYFLLHEDPVKLAMEIAGVSNKNDPRFASGLKRYNEKLRPRFVDEARNLFDSSSNPHWKSWGRNSNLEEWIA
jgi:hypothetical protein